MKHKSPAVEEPSIDRLRAGLRIDRDDLDSEIATQADSYFRVAEACALAASRRDEAKADMEEESARAANRVRLEAASHDEKITEAQIKEQTSKDKNYLTYVQAFLKAKSEADLWVAMRESFDMRGKMLRELAQLHIAGYYQITAVKGVGRQSQDIATAQTRRAMRSASRDD